MRKSTEAIGYVDIPQPLQQLHTITGQETACSDADRIRWRNDQPVMSRLCEYITGLQLDDPALIDRIVEDHKIIRSKYGLPSRDAVFDDPTGYERLLHEIAAELGVTVTDTSDCSNLLQMLPEIEAAYMNRGKRIAADVDRSNVNLYTYSLLALEHECIHAAQFSHSPSMPHEAKEYEAFIAGGSMRVLTQNPEVIEMVFRMIDSSVTTFYGKRHIPEWNWADYFIRNIDKIEPDTEAVQAAD